VEVWRSEPGLELSDVVDLDVDSKGVVFVADPITLTVTAIAPGGGTQRVIGRKGAGPGEFHGLGSVQSGPADTLFVFDNNLRRLSAFAPDADTAAYVRIIATYSRGAPQQAYRTAVGSRTLVTSMPPFQAAEGAGQAAGRQLVARLLGSDGSVDRDSLVVGIGSSNLFLRSGEMISVGTNVFGRQPLLRFSRTDRVFYARSDSTAVDVYALDGSVVRRCAFSSPPVEVTKGDLAREQDRTSRRLRPVLADSMPASWPPIGDLVVDDVDGAWFGLRGPGGTVTRWVHCDSTGRFSGEVTFPADVTLAAARDGLLYAVVLDEDQVPSVRAYRIDGTSTVRDD
jgi:hypothetical protein